MSTLLGGRLVVAAGDITRLAVDAIVNAANSSLMGGGGVDGAIHRAGGPAILEACRALRRDRYPGGLPAGEAVETTGGSLPARFVIHTVGPVWHGGSSGEEETLAACYRSCLAIATRRGLQAIAFPAVSTGVYGFPRDRAARVVWKTVSEYLAAQAVPHTVTLQFYSPDDMRIFLRECARFAVADRVGRRRRMSGPSPVGMSSLNWKEIDLVLSELSLDGCLIQEIHQPAHDRIVLNLFRAGAAFSVLISLSSRFPRMHVLSERLANPEKPLRFASFLRAHIRGGRIKEAVQIRAGAGGAAAPGERIVRISVLHAGEEKVLWVRLWGAAANAVLTDSEGIILDAFYRRPKKGEISGKPFEALGPARAGTAPRKEFTVREIPGEGTFNQKIERLFGGWETSGDTERLVAQADAELEMSENKLLANLEKLQGRLQEYGSLQRFKELGDLVTSSLHTLHKGDRWLEAEDFYHDNALVRIELAPELTPAENAESYYERHRKARLGRSKVEHEIGELTRTLEKIRRQREAIEKNPDPASLVKVAASAARARAPLVDAGTPGLVFSSPPFRIIVGRTAAENDTLLRKKVRGNDWWFHARDWPGAYVFVKAQAGKSLPLETMLDAATLAVHFSRGKTSGQGDVYYTQVKYLRRAKGAKKGTVLPTQEKNLHVKLDPERIERLKAGEE